MKKKMKIAIFHPCYANKNCKHFLGKKIYFFISKLARMNSADFAFLIYWSSTTTKSVLFFRKTTLIFYQKWKKFWILIDDYWSAREINKEKL